MWLLAALIAAPLAAFGGRNLLAAGLFAAVSIAFAVVSRPPLVAIDRLLLALLGVVAIQCLPLPAAIVDAVSPHAIPTRAALALSAAERPSVLPVSLDAASTAWAGAVVAGAAGLFLTARGRFAIGGLRLFARAVAAIGMGVSLLALAQAATAGRRIYWTFPTDVEGPLPFGPFVNRNHFATWVIMAIPFTFGYLAAHTLARHARGGAAAHLRARIARWIDPRAAWLTAAIGLMLVALLISLSRAGTLALGVTTLATLWLTRRSIDAPQRRWAAAAVILLAAFAILWSDLPALAARLAATHTSVANRLTIWRETMPIVRDFWLTGTGAGTYQLAMFVYQRADRTVYFNQAHNQYLQVVAEGGLLLAVPVVLSAIAFVRLARRRIAEDGTSVRWIRIGAAAGLAAAALQSVWETGLVMPANAALAAALAAALVHERGPAGGGA